MEFLQPTTWAEALAMKAARPDALPIAGGTDVMVEINFDRHRPAAFIDLTRIPELSEWGSEDGLLRVGAGVTYTRLMDELGDRIGPKRNAMRSDELIAAFLIPPANGPQQFSKVGTRNAMVIAVCSFALAIDPQQRHIGTGIGSAAPTPVTADSAERFLEGVLDEGGLWDQPAAVETSALARFGELVAAAARPIDDVRGTAAYRRLALAVMARRSFTWAWNEYRGAA
jgi:CO/xanthine dehydrogenase FAD-binding subunit